MLGGGVARPLVGVPDHGSDRIVRQVANLDHRQVVLLDQRPGDVIVVECRQDQAVDPAPQQSPDDLLLIGRIIAARAQYELIVVPPKYPADPLDRGGEVRVEQRRNDDADHTRAVGGQRHGDQIGDVAAALGLALDPGAGVRPHLGIAAQRPRYRDRRQAGSPCDVADRDPAGLAARHRSVARQRSGAVGREAVHGRGPVDLTGPQLLSTGSPAWLGESGKCCVSRQNPSDWR